MELTPVQKATRDIVPAHLAVQAMRDNGYKSAAYALAELMDNSIQAKAKHVELLCGERQIELEQRSRSRIHQIAVLDDGSGMDADVLRIALQFGNGTHLSPDTQEGIGKFGMGLPSSSISQCTRVDVWSWQNGVANALHSYLDIDEIKQRKMTEVPEPSHKAIPEVWRTVGKHFGNTGTLVVWSNLDRVMWKTARSIIRNSELIIGRMYRSFLHSGESSIRLYAFDIDYPREKGTEEYALPNDPLYLMDSTSCPDPFDDKPMFERWGDPAVIKIEHKGEVHDVKVTFSVAKEDARNRPNAGNLSHGRHAAKNVGVSVVRAQRELELNDSWVIHYDPRERWWGVEVDFPPGLDDIFGVSNNKQTARNFYQMDVEALLLEGETVAQLKDRLKNEEDPAGPLFELSHLIDKNLVQLRELIKKQRLGEQRGRQRHEEVTDERYATDKTKERMALGRRGESDETEDMPPAEREQEICEELIEAGMAESTAREIAAQTVHDGLKYTFVDAQLETSAFFTVTIKGGSLIIKLNTTHPAHQKLVEVLEDEIDDADEGDLRERLKRARSGLRLILMAWARYEDEKSGVERIYTQDARNDWGRIARDFLTRVD
jgi:hypothetical protein